MKKKIIFSIIIIIIIYLVLLRLGLKSGSLADVKIIYLFITTKLTN